MALTEFFGLTTVSRAVPESTVRTWTANFALTTVSVEPTTAILGPSVIAPSIAPTDACVDCNAKIVGGIYDPPIVTGTTSNDLAQPTYTGPSGIVTPGPTMPFGVGPWYRQTWTLPAAWFMCVYSLTSCILMMLLLWSGRLDWRGNIRLSSSSNRYRSTAWLLSSDLMDEPTVTLRPTQGHRQGFWEGQRAQREQRQQPEQRDGADSIAETRISYGEDDGQRHDVHLSIHTQASDFEMLPIARRRPANDLPDDYIRYIVHNHPGGVRRSE